MARQSTSDLEIQPLISSDTLTHSSTDNETIDNGTKRRGTIGAVGMLMLVGAAVFASSSHSKPTQLASQAKSQLYEYRDQCSLRDGVFNPDGTACCARSCGTNCDGPDCARGAGGKEACCAKDMLHYCGTGDQAPCKLGLSDQLKKVTTQCGKYGGIDHPSENKCCGASCGALCGAANCQQGYGGYKSCCGNLTDVQPCSLGVSAPCELVHLNKVFVGLVELKLDRESFFVNAPKSLVAAHDALVKATGVKPNEVIINGLPLRWPADGKPHADIDYQFKLPSLSTMTANDISSKAPVMVEALNAALAAQGLTVHVQEAVMPLPTFKAHAVSHDMPVMGSIVNAMVPEPASSEKKGDDPCATKAPAVSGLPIGPPVTFAPPVKASSAAAVSESNAARQGTTKAPTDAVATWFKKLLPKL